MTFSYLSQVWQLTYYLWRGEQTNIITTVTIVSFFIFVFTAYVGPGEPKLISCNLSWNSNSHGTILSESKMGEKEKERKQTIVNRVSKYNSEKICPSFEL